MTIRHPHLVLNDLEPPFMRWGVSATLSELLDGTVAGAELAEMNAHSAALSARHAAKAAYESPKVVAQRSEARRVLSERELEQRLEKKLARDLKRDQFVAELTTLSEVERLVKIVTHKPEIPLEIIPDHLVPVGANLNGLDEETRNRLIVLVDRRKGAWGRLRRLLIRTRS